MLALLRLINCKLLQYVMCFQVAVRTKNGNRGALTYKQTYIQH